MPPSVAQRIADELHRRIDTGELAAGDLLPSARAITREWHVAIATATRVHAILREAGVAESLPGVGVVVRRPAPTYAPAGPLRTEVVVARAVAIADAEGMEAVSMRRLAVELGTAPMNLYRHVADKEDLRLRMFDAALGEWRPPERGDAGWRECLEAAAHGFWQLFRRHPWLAPGLSLTRPLAVAGGVGWTEFVLDSLADPIPDPTARFDVLLVLFSYVRGFAAHFEAEHTAEALTGIDAEEWIDNQLPTLRAISDPARHPRFTEVVHTAYDFDADRVFERGLRGLLDGLAVELGG